MHDIRVSFDETCPGMEPRVLQFEKLLELQSIVTVDGVEYRVKEGNFDPYGDPQLLITLTADKE